MAKLRSAYYPHPRVHSVPEGASMTQQNFRDETDINLILAKYAKTGLLDHVNKFGGRYADMPDENDFHTAMSLVTNAQSMFNELPSGIRSKFYNDPSQFLDFLDNPENREEAIEMGLYPRPDPEAVIQDEMGSKGGDTAPNPKKEPDKAPKGDESPK